MQQTRVLTRSCTGKHQSTQPYASLAVRVSQLYVTTQQTNLTQDPYLMFSWATMLAKGYRCLYPPTGRVYISRHVVFDEGSYPFAEKYKHLQLQLSTPLMSAWHRSFPPASQPQPASNENNQSQSPSTPEPTVTTEQIIPLFNERDFPPLQPSGEASASSAPAPLPQPVPAPVPPVPVQPPTVSDQAASTSCHPMTTRSKSTLCLMTSKVTYPKPKTVIEALKYKRWHDPMSDEINNCHET